MHYPKQNQQNNTTQFLSTGSVDQRKYKIIFCDFKEKKDISHQDHEREILWPQAIQENIRILEPFFSWNVKIVSQLTLVINIADITFIKSKNVYIPRHLNITKTTQQQKYPLQNNNKTNLVTG